MQTGAAGSEPACGKRATGCGSPPEASALVQALELPEEVLEVSAFAAGLSVLVVVLKDALPPDDDVAESVLEDESLLFDESVAEEAASLSALFFFAPLISSRESLR